MKARTKIQLITTAFAMTTALVFSAVIFWELIEQPIRLIDRELYEIKEQLLKIPAVRFDSAASEPVLLTSSPFDKYGISVFSHDNKLLLQTKLAEKVGFQFRPEDRYYFKRAVVDIEDLHLNEDDRDDVGSLSGEKTFFRVHNFSVTIRHTPLNILVSRPIPVLVHEVVELVTGVAYSLAICCVVVPCIGFILATRILKPVNTINDQIREITSSSLYKRLPVSASKDELQTLSISLNQMFDRLEFSFDRQREFIGNASHDLKSPLTSLMLGLEKLLSEDLPENIQATVEKQLHTTRRVSRLVHNLLELSRLEQQETFRMEDVDLKTSISALLEEFEELLVAHKITVTTQLDDIHVTGDKEKLSRVVINLLDNAIKYNLSSAGTIDVKLTRDSDWAVIEIANTGTLIPGESLPKLFDQFYRVEKSRSLEFGGSGLGLTIVKQIVELHQGYISVHNSPPNEIVFTVHLPL